MIKAIIFDMDDTLYKEHDFVFSGFNAVAEYLSEKYNLDKEDLYKEIQEIFYQEGRGRILNIICERHNLNENINELIDIYRFHNPEIKLYDDAKEIINWCKENKIKTGIITDGMSKVQWNKVKALGLDICIDKVIVSDDFGQEFWKPHTRTYEEIIKHFSVEGKEAIYIGDNPKKDFIGAKELKIHTIRIVRNVGDYVNLQLGMEFEAEVIIKNLNEIKEICSSKYGLG